MMNRRSCENCGKSISSREAEVTTGALALCPACRRQLFEGGDFQFEDRAGAWPEKPTPGRFSISRVELFAVERLRLILLDLRTSELVSIELDVPHGVPVRKVVSTAEQSQRYRVRKLSVVARTWVHKSELSKLEMGLLGVAIYGLITQEGLEYPAGACADPLTKSFSQTAVG